MIFWRAVVSNRMDGNFMSKKSLAYRLKDKRDLENQESIAEELNSYYCIIHECSAHNTNV